MLTPKKLACSTIRAGILRQLVSGHAIHSGIKGLLLHGVVVSPAFSFSEGFETLGWRADLNQGIEHGIQILGIELATPERQVNGIHIPLKQTVGLILRV